MNTTSTSSAPRRTSRAVRITVGALALGSVLLFALYVYFDMENAALDDAARSHAPGQFIQLPDGVTHYEFSGPEDGPIVVLVHGVSTPYFIWDPTVEALREAGFRVLRYDLFGRGYSDRPDAAYDLPFFAKQLDDLLTALEIEEPVNVAGLSMGGPVAAAFVNRHPERVRSLILIDPLVLPPDRAIAKVIEIPWLGEYLMTTAIVPFVLLQSQREDFHRPERMPADWMDKYRVQLQYKGFRRGLLASVRTIINKNVAMPEYEAIGQRGAPTLLLWGAEDQTITREHIEALRAAIPAAQFHVIEDAGHLPHYEHPEVVNPLMVEFLKAQ